jgi:sugar O-acyltransferase (sialic acid O-acetyltransferase NeuD family)
VTKGRELYVAGTRSFAAEVAGFAEDAGFRVAGLLEPYDRERVGRTIHGFPVTWLEDKPAGRERVAIVGTGESARRAVVGRLLAAGWEIATLLHPRAHLARTSTVGVGTVAGPGVVVGAYTTIGEHVVVGRGVLAGHHTEIGDFATICPGANVAGNVRIGADAFIGMAAVIRDHVAVGSSAVVAMGAVVVRDVGPGVEVRGLPAAVHETEEPGSY